MCIRSIVIVLGMIFFLGCNQGDERIAEKARIEGEEGAKGALQAQLDEKDRLIEKAKLEGKAAAEAELKAQNENQVVKTQEMEADLATRQRFYQAVHGTYEGNLKISDDEERNVKITVVPSLPPYPTTRKRQIEEIVSDLNNLSFNVQVVQWDPQESISGVDCRAEHIRPDVVKGEISIASENCPNTYILRIASQDPIPNVGSASTAAMSKPQISMALASSIRDGTTKEVSQMEGQVHPARSGATYSLSVTKVR